MNILENLQYTRTHEWVDPETGAIGLSDFAQHALGDIVFVNLPIVGDAVVAGEVFCDVESVKAVSDVYSPASGTIVAVNEALADEPGLINDDPYNAWIIKIEPCEPADDLMDGSAYTAFAEEAAE